MQNVIFLGAPGAGKGTQCQILIDRGYKVVSTGKLLRDEVANQTELGQKVKAIMAAGGLVDDDLIFNMVNDFVAKHLGKAPIVFDGFPRNLAQAERLDQLLAMSDNQITKVILLDVDAEEVIARLSKRYECGDCGKVSNFDENVDLVCPFCGSHKLKRRSDDEPEVIAQRLKSYEELTRPLIDYYQQQQKLVTYTGNASVADISQKIKNCLEGDKV